MVEAELFPALRRLGIRFYAYNPVSHTPLAVPLWDYLCVLTACWWSADWEVREGEHV